MPSAQHRSRQQGTSLVLCLVVLALLLSSCARKLEGAPCPCPEGLHCCHGECIPERVFCPCPCEADMVCCADYCMKPPSVCGQQPSEPPGDASHLPERDASTDSGAASEDDDAGVGADVAIAELGQLPRHCSPDGWCGGRHPLEAVFGLGVNDIWAVSGDDVDRQTFQHWDGTRWQNVRNEQLRDEARVHGIHGQDRDVWFVGTNGRLGMVLRFDGTSFHDYYAVDDTSEFRAVWVGSDHDVWVAGAPGSLAHWDGQYFTRDSTQDADLHALWAASEDDLWAVGTAGTVLHWNGKAWARHGVAEGLSTRSNLWSIWGSSAHDVWAAGSDRTLVHWDGTRWQELDLSMWMASTVGLQAVYGAGAHDVWLATSEGTLLHFDGQHWSRGEAPVARGSLHALWVAPSGELWAVGADAAAVHWDGASWLVSAEPVASDLFDVWGTGADDLWAVGSGGTILHGNGKSWQAAQSPTQQPLRALHGTGKDDVWAAGDAMLHWDGQRWSQVYDDDAQLHGLWALSPDDVWAVGDDANGGVIFHLVSGTWQVHERFPGRRLRKVWASAADDVWVQYDTDGGLRWDGASWRELPIPERDSIYESLGELLVGSATDGMWLLQVEDRNPYHHLAVRKYGAQGWDLLYSVRFEHRLGDVLMLEPENMYIAGDGLWKFDGSRATLSSRRADLDLRGLWGTSALDLWSVGMRGALLHREPFLTVPSVHPATPPCGDVQSDTRHCGSCGVQCVSKLASCVSGACKRRGVSAGQGVRGESHGNPAGGEAFRFACESDEVLVGLVGQTGLASTVSVGARCAVIMLDRAGGEYLVSVDSTFDAEPPDHQLSEVDPSTPWNSEWYTLDCPEGTVLTALSGASHVLSESFSTPTVGKLGIQCSRVTSQGEQLFLAPLDGFTEEGHVNGGASSFEEHCPAGSAISAVAGTTGWLLDSVAVECSPLSIADVQGSQLLSDYARESGVLPEL